MDPTYLIFGHRGARYGLDVAAVHEIVWLPALSPIEELPPYIAGVFNLHGQVIPVMDLCLRFGHTREPYALSDYLIVLQGEAGAVALLANELHDFVTPETTAIEDVRGYQGAGGQAQFILGEAKLGDGLAMLLDVGALLRCAPSGDLLEVESTPGTAQELARLFGSLSATELDLLHDRAQRLAEIPAAGLHVKRSAWAVFRLGSELYALPLEVVREFSHVRGVAPVPCCPPHILGNMNLRGDILTLADIRPALGLATDDALTEVVVVQAGELLWGLAASEIVEVVQLAPDDIAALPVASERGGRAYCQGVASVGALSVGLLDLEQLLGARALQVAQAAP